MTRPGDPSFSAILDQHLSLVYGLCSRMTLSGLEAENATFQTFARAANGAPPRDPAQLELWLLKIASHVVQSQIPADPEVDFDLLDETLRSEATRTQEVASMGSPEREFLLWELKQGCMTAVINCLSPAERIAFVMSAVLGRGDEDASLALGIKVSAFKVRLSRARKKISDYLAPRCEHIDPRNPCHCPSRVGVALAKGFIAPPMNPVVQLRTASRPFEQEQKARDAVDIFRTLPAQEIPAPLRARLDQACASGVWT